MNKATGKGKLFVKNSFVYALGKALTLLMSVFLLPLYTKNIPPESYGYFELTRSIIDLLIPFLCMEMWFGVFRLYFSKQREKGHSPEHLFASSFYFCSLVALLISGGFAVAAFVTKRGNWVLSALLIFATTYSSLFMHYARTLKNSVAFSTSGIIASLVNGFVGIFCVLVLRLQEEAMFLALICGYAAQTVVLFFWIKAWRFLSPRFFSFPALGSIVKFSWPLGIATVLYYLSKGFVQLLISTFTTQDNVAFYTVSLRFTAIIVVFANVLAMSWMDVVFAIQDPNERIAMINKWTNAFFKFFAVLSVCIVPFLGLAFSLLVDAQYKEAFFLLPFSMASAYFSLAGNILLSPLHSENKTILDMLAKIIAAAFAISGFFIVLQFAPRFAGIVAYLLGVISEFVALQIIGNKVLKLSISWQPTVIFVISYAAMATVFVLLPPYVSVAFAIVLAVGGFIYCYDVIRIYARKVFPNLPDDIGKTLLNHLRAKPRLLVGSLSFVFSLAAALSAIQVNNWQNGSSWVIAVFALALAALCIIMLASSAENPFPVSGSLFALVFIIFCFAFSGLVIGLIHFAIGGDSPDGLLFLPALLVYGLFYLAYVSKRLFKVRGQQ